MYHAITMNLQKNVAGLSTTTVEILLGVWRGQGLRERDNWTRAKDWFVSTIRVISGSQIRNRSRSGMWEGT